MGLGDKVAARLNNPPSSGSLKERASSQQRGSSSSAAGSTAAAARSSAAPSSTKSEDSEPPAPLPPASTAGAAEERPSRFERQYSTASWNTVSTLQQFELQVTEMEERVKDYAKILANPPPEGLDPAMRNQMAQLHGDFNRILDTKIDAILTSDLNSGKEDARAKRKALSAKCGTIIEEIEGLVKAYDAQRSAAKSV
uniref:Uncharacterized protein n=1 Tax=Haptolina brevifila TaxID=156173 RepID=A0A7S2FNN7_9EUKA|mmetsp:Transcript_16014/g.32130  ORF Transcript_16014/g.32130 Transcript_16014/m.32130 type:complete len:197 (+) Transcript_16014:59-649(+)